MSTKQEDRHEITRVTRFIPKPFEEVIARLRSSIKKTNSAAPSIFNHLDSKEVFEDYINSLIGPHGFMEFVAFQHGAWMSLYGVHVGTQSTRIIFGNPQIAITMLKRDVTAGLFVPVETLLVEREDGKGTDVVQIKPSSLIAGVSGSSPELREAAEKLDEKVEKLWEFVAGGQSLH